MAACRCIGGAIIAYAVALGMDIKVVVPVEDDAAAALREQVMNRRGPTGALLGERFLSVEFRAAPLEETRRLHATAPLGRLSTAEVMTARGELEAFLVTWPETFRTE